VICDAAGCSLLGLLAICAGQQCVPLRYWMFPVIDRSMHWQMATLIALLLLGGMYVASNTHVFCSSLWAVFSANKWGWIDVQAGVSAAHSLVTLQPL